METALRGDSTYALTGSGRALRWELASDEARLDVQERVALAIALVQLERARPRGCGDVRR